MSLFLNPTCTGQITMVWRLNHKLFASSNFWLPNRPDEMNMSWQVHLIRPNWQSYWLPNHVQIQQFRHSSHLYHIVNHDFGICWIMSGWFSTFFTEQKKICSLIFPHKTQSCPARSLWDPQHLRGVQNPTVVAAEEVDRSVVGRPTGTTPAGPAGYEEIFRQCTCFSSWSWTVGLDTGVAKNHEPWQRTKFWDDTASVGIFGNYSRWK